MRKFLALLITIVAIVLIFQGITHDFNYLVVVGSMFLVFAVVCDARPTLER